jgi:uncharacterized membrane protein HdeD (DUF308 family)
LLGIVLVMCGLAAIVLPAISTIAASVVLGAVLVLAGIVKIIEALQVQGWVGSARQLLVGAVEIVGGVVVYSNPVGGAFALGLVIAAIFAVQGVMQTSLAFKVRPQPGWRWLLVSALIALCVSVGLVLKLRYAEIDAPAVIAGVSFLVAGFAYIAIALATRRVGSERHALGDTA